MDEQRQRPKQPQAYTDKTIVMPGRRRPAPPEAELPPTHHAPSAPHSPAVATPRATRHARPSARPNLRQQVRDAPRRNVGRIVRRTLLVVAALLVLALVLVYIQMARIDGQTVVRDVRPNAPIASPLIGGVNVLIVGVDERPNAPEEGVRSDTLIVAHMNAGGRWVNLLSIPRDSLVTVPDVGDTKINVAYGQGYTRAAELYGDATPQQGGMALTAQTVEQLLGWPDRGQRIDYTVQINFDGFAKIIDALGGVTIDVPKPIVDDAYPTEDFGYQRIEFQPGLQRMDGQRALIYARTRHADSDFDRGARQQQVVRAILTEFQSRGPLGQALVLPRLADGLEGTIVTTLPIARPDTLLALAWLGTGLNPDELGKVRLTPELDPELVQDGAFNLIWSQNGIQTAVDGLLMPPGEVTEAATVQVLNGTGVAGLAGRVTSQLEAGSFTVVPAADAPGDMVERTVVYDLNGNPRTARRLGQVLNASVREGSPDGVTSGADIVVILGRDAVE